MQGNIHCWAVSLVSRGLAILELKKEKEEKLALRDLRKLMSKFNSRSLESCLIAYA